MSVFYRTVETYGGDYMEADCFPVFTESPIRGKKRRARFRPTSEVQERYNQKLAERRLVRLIHANFTEADYSIGLDYGKRIGARLRVPRVRECGSTPRRAESAA